MSKKRVKNIVTIGGGAGSYTVLSALRKYSSDNFRLHAIVSMADDGGSTGILRNQYGVLPAGDVRQALIALSNSDSPLTNLFQYRFQNGSLKGHNAGSIMLAAMEKTSGTFSMALREASKILDIKGEVIPVTLENVRLCAQLQDGTVIRGEANIDIPRDPFPAKIRNIWLSPAAPVVNPRAKEVLHEADLVVICPGDLYTSIIPNFLVKGVTKAVRRSRARKIYVANLMSKSGETQDFSGEDFAKAIEAYVGPNVIDYMLFNKTMPAPEILERYKEEKAEFVKPPIEFALNRQRPIVVRASLISSGDVMRHDEEKLGRLLLSLL